MILTRVRVIYEYVYARGRLAVDMNVLSNKNPPLYFSRLVGLRSEQSEHMIVKDLKTHTSIYNTYTPTTPPSTEKNQYFRLLLAV